MKIFSIVHKALRRFFDLFQFSFIHEQSFQTKFTKENPKLLGLIRRKKFFQNQEQKILFQLNFTRAKNSNEQKNPNTNNEYSCSYEEHSMPPQMLQRLSHPSQFRTSSSAVFPTVGIRIQQTLVLRALHQKLKAKKVIN